MLFLSFKYVFIDNFVRIYFKKDVFLDINFKSYK